MKFLVVFSYSLLLDISHIDGKLTGQPVCVGYYEMPRKIGKRKIHFFREGLLVNFSVMVA